MKKIKKGKLFVVSGPSGVGKSSLVKDALRELKDFEKSISVTTRIKRDDEKDGEHYHFINEEEFKVLIEKGELIEWAFYCGNYYGTLKKTVVENLKKGKNIILVIEVSGAMQVKKIIKDAYLIFITTPDFFQLEKRLRGRQTENVKKIEERLKKAKEELRYEKHYDCIIVNNNYNEALKNLKYVLITKMEENFNEHTEC
ncbi:MAG: guanylate kinase [Actinomycetota bacterium]|jgi:guanylate kinase|nr:guanylate kinase [Actinomycetota bacterium]